MNKFTKLVNIYPSMPITGVNPPIRTVVKRVTKSVEEIRACLMARAVIEEILSDGKIVRLNIGNYDKCLEPTCVNGCKCGRCNGWKLVESAPEFNTTSNGELTPWQVAYNKALEGKNLAIMSRKQRRSAEAAARAAADAVVASSEPEVVMGVGTIESAEEVRETEVTVDESVETEEVVDIQEEEVQTVDVEDTSSITE